MVAVVLRNGRSHSALCSSHGGGLNQSIVYRSLPTRAREGHPETLKALVRIALMVEIWALVLLAAYAGLF